MRAKFLEYLLPPGQGFFDRDFSWAVIQLFALHDLRVVLADSARSIHSEWVRLAGEFSLLLPDADGVQRATPDPLCLTQIKQAGILAHVIATAKPVSQFRPLTPAGRNMLHEKGIATENRDADLLMKYPHEMVALSIVEVMFMRFQMTRDGAFRSGINPGHPPYTDHYRRNLCILMKQGRMGAEGLYMIFKTMDLYGYVAEPRKLGSVTNGDLSA